MELIQLVVLLIVIGVLLWLVNTYIPMDDTIKRIINAVVIVAVVVWLLFWLLSIFGIAHMRIGALSLPSPPEGRGGGVAGRCLA